MAWALAAMLGAASAGPSLAAIDAAALTCGEFNAADGVGRDAYGRAVLLWANNTRNWRQSGTLSAWFINDTKKDVRQKISWACNGQPDGTNVVTVLQTRR
jgi:hypothetical protein